ncbi:uncharacterized protein LOC132554993 [Ylistrum balloti]|uniref:uncharacterized protein LOC132554993 n=1 Tax=Ylistrum balloti TaxID=509963 RepID=UPI002905C7CB|nr:uncharacterized protein LOC132554993 [Ylistrum balloti]
MKCSVHEDQTVIMACRTQQCEDCLVCVLCIAGLHRGHEMTTLEEAAERVKERLNDMSTANINYLKGQKRKIDCVNSLQEAINQKQEKAREQGQMMHDAVDRVIGHIISNYERRSKEMKAIMHKIQDSIEIVEKSQERLGHVLDTDDWIKIILEGKKTTELPSVEDLSEDVTPDVGEEDINKTIVTGILSALQQCQPPTAITEQPCHPATTITKDDEHTSDFKGMVYRHRTLKSISCVSLSKEHRISNIAPGQTETFWVVINDEIKFCNKQHGIINNNLTIKNIFRGMAVTESDKLLTTCTDDKCVRKITSGGKTLFSFNTDPLIPNQLCIANNGDILVTLVSSFVDPLPDTVGVVSRYTPQGKRMVTFERDRFGNSICPKYIAASRVSDMVAVTTITNKDNEGYYNSHVIVMTGDLQVKFRYLSDGRVILGDQQYRPHDSTIHFSVGIDSQDNIILGDIKAGSIQIIDQHGHKLQCFGHADGMNFLTVSFEDEIWIGKKNGQVEVFKYT